jgi:hypothetical protein
MEDHPRTLDDMLAAWNERDPDKVRGHLDRALAPDVVFCDPANYVVGIDAFEAMVRKFRADLPEAVCARTSGLDGHHGRYRYDWSVSVDGKVLVPGADVTTLNEGGRVERVDGFFGPLPPLT